MHNPKWKINSILSLLTHVCLCKIFPEISIVHIILHICARRSCSSLDSTQFSMNYFQWSTSMKYIRNTFKNLFFFSLYFSKPYYYVISPPFLRLNALKSEKKFKLRAKMHEKRRIFFQKISTYSLLFHYISVYKALH